MIRNLSIILNDPNPLRIQKLPFLKTSQDPSPHLQIRAKYNQIKVDPRIIANKALNPSNPKRENALRGKRWKKKTLLSNPLKGYLY